MQNIELVYDVDCPNVEGARAVLREALQEAGLDPEWIEWDREDPISPPHARMYGSPTVLVDGRDVSGEGGEANANCCRVYTAADGNLRGVPSRESVLSALQALTADT